MAEYFGSRLGSSTHGCVLSLRARVALDIVRSSALITGAPDGEDSAGRQKLNVMPAADVADRAIDIADAMVTRFEERGWVAEALSADEDAAEVGRLERVKRDVEFESLRKKVGAAVDELSEKK